MPDAVSYVDDDDSNVVMPQRRTPVSQDNEDLVVKGKAPASLFLDLQKRQKKHSEAGQVNGSDESLKSGSVAQFLLIIINA